MYTQKEIPDIILGYQKWRFQNYEYCFGVYYELVTPGVRAITNGKFYKERTIIKKYLKEVYNKK